MKTFLDMSDKDISDIVKILYQTKHHENITSITRYKDYIKVYMEAYGHTEDGKDEKLADDDMFILLENEILVIGFIINDKERRDNNRRYQQFLFAKGSHWINQDNEFLFEEE